MADLFAVGDKLTDTRNGNTYNVVGEHSSWYFLRQNDITPPIAVEKTVVHQFGVRFGGEPFVVGRTYLHLRHSEEFLVLRQLPNDLFDVLFLDVSDNFKLFRLPGSERKSCIDAPNLIDIPPAPAS